MYADSSSGLFYDKIAKNSSLIKKKKFRHFIGLNENNHWLKIYLKKQKKH